MPLVPAPAPPSVFLRRLGGQVGDQCGDGADVRDDSEDDGEHREPQRLAGRRVGSLEISLSRRLVGLEGERVR